MIPGYEAIKKQLMDNLQIDESHFYCEDNEEFQSSRNYPVILFLTPTTWGLSDNQDGVDLKKEIKVNVNLTMNVFTNDIDDLIRIEEFAGNYYSEPKNLFEMSEDSSVKYATIMLAPDYHIEHEQQKAGYRIIVTFSIKNFIKPMEVVNPVKVELDKPTQLQVMIHLALINATWDQIFEKRDEIEDSEENTETFKLYSQQLSDLESQANSMYNFQNVTKIDLKIEDDSFLTCYNVMIQNNVDIPAACKIIEDRRLEKERKNKKLNDYLNKHGDPSIDRYTDAIANNMMEKLKSVDSVKVYGGSTYWTFFHDFEAGSLSLPCILIKDNFDAKTTNYFMAKEKDIEVNYNTVDSNNKQTPHRYTIRAVPINYNIQLLFYSKSEDQLQGIEQKLLNEYDNEVLLTVPDPIYKKEFDPIKISISHRLIYQVDTFKYNDGIIYRKGADLNVIPTIYYVKDYTAEEIQNDSRLQLFQLQLARSYLEALECIDSVINPSMKGLQELMNPNNDSKGFLKQVGSLFDSADYKELKRCVENHLPINKNTFEKVYAKLLKCNPSLYDDIVVKRKPVKDVWDVMRKSENAIKEMFNDLCDRIGLPASTTTIRDENERGADAIDYYTGVFKRDSDATIYDAVNRYQNYLEEKEAEREAEREARRERREEIRENGGGFFSSMLGAGIGSYVGNSGTRKEVRNLSNSVDKASKEQQKLARKQANEEHSRAAHESRVARDKVIKENQERRKKGLPELPVPPADWY